MRVLKKFFTSIVFVLLTMSMKAKANDKNPLLVLDVSNAVEFPKKFRTSADFLTNDRIDKRGLENLYILGSAQFSKLALEKILQHLHVKYLTIIDLRQESHGFLNANAISWYDNFNAVNANKTPAQIEYDQENLLNQLNEHDAVTVNKILEKNSMGEIKKTKPIEFAVHQVFTEEEVAKKYHLGYYRIYVQDHFAPQPHETDRFIELVNKLPKQSWIYFHCRAGSGRTTTFMTMYDIMQNAKLLSFEAILARQVALGGTDLSQLPEKTNPNYIRALKRYHFIKTFYLYAKENNDHFKTLWTDWLKQDVKPFKVIRM